MKNRICTIAISGFATKYKNVTRQRYTNHSELYDSLVLKENEKQKRITCQCYYWGKVRGGGIVSRPILIIGGVSDPVAYFRPRFATFRVLSEHLPPLLNQVSR